MLDAIIKSLQAELNIGGASPVLKLDGIAGPRTIFELQRQQRILSPQPVVVDPGHYPPKMTTRAAAIARYGAIDLAHAHWPDQNKWMSYLILPEGFCVEKIYCNNDIHQPLLDALTEIKAKGLAGVLKTFDGCHNIRAVRGSNLMSTHAYGLALDWNANINPLAGDHGDFTRHMDVVDCFTRKGFRWGGYFNGRLDQMHFSRAWEG